MLADPQTNFSFLSQHDEQLVRLGRLAERYFPEDPNTCLLKLRQLAEVLAQLTATGVGIFLSADEGQYELINRLRNQGILTAEVAQLFGEVRRAGARRALGHPRGLLGKIPGGEAKRRFWLAVAARAQECERRSPSKDSRRIRMMSPRGRCWRGYGRPRSTGMGRLSLHGRWPIRSQSGARIPKADGARVPRRRGVKKQSRPTCGVNERRELR